MKKLFFPGLFLMLAAPFVFAQTRHTTTHTPPTPAQIVANQVARLTALLSLNSTQQGEATTIFTTEQSVLSPLGASMKTARTALKTAIQANDSGAIAQQSAEIGSLSGQEIQAEATANAGIYAMLTPEQQTKYGQFGALAGGRGGFAGGGFGGFARGAR